MPINNGQIEGMISIASGGEIRYTIQYDNTVGVNADGTIDSALQPLVNRAGNCLVATNTSGETRQVSVTSPTSGEQTFSVPPGTVSVNANQMRQRGFATRADVTNSTIS